MYFVSMLFLYVYIYKIIIRPDVILVVTLYVLGTIFQRTEFIYIYKLISACSMVRENVFTGSRIGWNLAQELRGGRGSNQLPNIGKNSRLFVRQLVSRRLKSKPRVTSSPEEKERERERERERVYDTTNGDIWRLGDVFGSEAPLRRHIRKF